MATAGSQIVKNRAESSHGDLRPSFGSLSHTPAREFVAGSAGGSAVSAVFEATETLPLESTPLPDGGEVGS